MNAAMSTNAELLKVSGLQMRFGGLLAVDGIEFDVRRDEVFAITLKGHEDTLRQTLAGQD